MANRGFNHLNPFSPPEYPYHSPPNQQAYPNLHNQQVYYSSQTPNSQIQQAYPNPQNQRVFANPQYRQVAPNPQNNQFGHQQAAQAQFGQACQPVTLGYSTLGGALVSCDQIPHVVAQPDQRLIPSHDLGKIPHGLAQQIVDQRERNWRLGSHVLDDFVETTVKHVQEGAPFQELNGIELDLINEFPDLVERYMEGLRYACKHNENRRQQQLNTEKFDPLAPLEPIDSPSNLQILHRVPTEPTGSAFSQTPMSIDSARKRQQEDSMSVQHEQASHDRAAQQYLDNTRSLLQFVASRPNPLERVRADVENGVDQQTRAALDYSNNLERQLQFIASRPTPLERVRADLGNRSPHADGFNSKTTRGVGTRPLS
ncbi:hypothetical protein P153DRAFT_405096 [Dothidotthia symphoricarpi CBS 119687]|uniref:Uncharacterized protein n=1 Tax=Dothidotthia symphoricarpi CBS 119687 TaxID=1392245 RepID=A0A6A6AB50_9PLEO|nr:uncharacterized protein P153DRAFT_405096 [Dothidotthia symphoricarpi CBS 119687]KAF2127931.1 hypothetical protein P153DRAFT_405096 [Dothidotthia symphoricarpi CBS 119687]